MQSPTVTPTIIINLHIAASDGPRRHARSIQLRYAKLDQLLDGLDDRAMREEYSAEADDPEQCSALGASLWELAALASHYHPVVASSAKDAAKLAHLPANAASHEKVLKVFNTAGGDFNPPLENFAPAPTKKRRRRGKASRKRKKTTSSNV